MPASDDASGAPLRSDPGRHRRRVPRLPPLVPVRSASGRASGMRSARRRRRSRCSTSAILVTLSGLASAWFGHPRSTCSCSRRRRLADAGLTADSVAGDGQADDRGVRQEDYARYRRLRHLAGAGSRSPPATMRRQALKLECVEAFGQALDQYQFNGTLELAKGGAKPYVVQAVARAEHGKTSAVSSVCRRHGVVYRMDRRFFLQRQLARVGDAVSSAPQAVSSLPLAAKQSPLLPRRAGLASARLRASAWPPEPTARQPPHDRPPHLLGNVSSWRRRSRPSSPSLLPATRSLRLRRGDRVPDLHAGPSPRGRAAQERAAVLFRRPRQARHVLLRTLRRPRRGHDEGPCLPVLAALFTFSGTNPDRLYWVAVVFGQ